MTLDSAHAAASHEFPGRNDIPAATVLIRRVDFLACIDTGVRAILADPARVPPTLRQLREWLDGDTQLLEDGIPVDHALFDAVLLGAAERLPEKSVVIRAARILAEAVYAKAPSF